ncbi:MAG: hypothetical protein ACPF85_07430 [Luminiphilus sp.]
MTVDNDGGVVSIDQATQHVRDRGDKMFCTQMLNGSGKIRCDGCEFGHGS